ncbi:thioesterase II family protein [Streptomyces sp. NPDC017520]|uniref:thioesterase II family protein n=1 Tax=Streptomyces sp. NPDC017520 TaxID=3364998 RepID=UPI0037B1FB75
MSIWFPTAPSATGAPLTLFCFPHAGGDLASFRHWQSGLGDGIDVAPVSLPGRERRISEPSFRSVTGLAWDLVAPTIARAGRTAFALLGHSMGAIIAFELAHKLTAAGRPPDLLIVSGEAAPQLPSRAPAVGGLSDSEFLDAVRAQGGMPDGLLDDPSFRELLVGVLRADYWACENYRFAPQPRLDVPMLVLGGDRDPGASLSELASWGELSSAPTVIRTFEGGHFFVVDRLTEVIAVVRSAVDEALEEWNQRSGSAGAVGVAAAPPAFAKWLKGRRHGKSV